MYQGFSDRPEVGQVCWTNEEIAECSLLMPGWQAAQLMAVAAAQRVTVGQLLRGLIHTYLARRATRKQRKTIGSARTVIR